MHHCRAHRSFIRTAQTRLGHLMDWPGSAHSTWGTGAFAPPRQAALPASALPASAVLAGQSRGVGGLCTRLLLPALNLLALFFDGKMARHGRTCRAITSDAGSTAAPACCGSWHGQQAGKAAVPRPQLLLSSLPTERLVPSGRSSPLLSRRVAP